MDFVKNNRFLIKTKEGYKLFSGISKRSHKNYISISTEVGEIQSSDKHLFMTENGFQEVSKLTKKMKLKTRNSDVKILDLKRIEREKDLYDIIEVRTNDNHFLLNNGLVTHNCQFLTFEKTLIETDVLDFYQTKEPEMEVNGFKIFHTELHHPDSLLILTIDPSAGGEDNSVIQLWEIAPKQVIEIASLTDKDLDASLIFEKVLWLQDFMKQQWNYNPDDALLIFERNGIGEGLAQILTQTERAIENLEIPLFYDKKGQPGIHTTPTAKSKIALQFKNLVEYNKLKINDPEFIDELYGFVRQTNGTYSAKSGYHDDRVTCAFLVVYYVYNVFADYAQGDFSVDTMMLVKPEEKIANTNNEEVDPAVVYRERMKKLEEEKKQQEEEERLKADKLKKEEEEKRKERERWAEQAMTPLSKVEEEDDDDDEIDYDEYDILPGLM